MADERFVPVPCERCAAPSLPHWLKTSAVDGKRVCYDCQTRDRNQQEGAS